MIIEYWNSLIVLPTCSMNPETVVLYHAFYPSSFYSTVLSRILSLGEKLYKTLSREV